VTSPEASGRRLCALRARCIRSDTEFEFYQPIHGFGSHDMWQTGGSRNLASEVECVKLTGGSRARWDREIKALSVSVQPDGLREAASTAMPEADIYTKEFECTTSY